MRNKVLWSIIYVAIYSFVIGYLMTFSLSTAPMVSYLGMVFSVIVNPFLAICTYLVIRMLDIVHTSFQVLSMEAIIIAVCAHNIYKYRRYLRKYLSSSIVFIFFAILSSIVGYQTSLKEVIPFFLLIVIFLTVSCMKLASQEKLIVMTLFVVGLFVAFFAYYQFASGGFFSETGRLGLEGNIRRVSNAVAFPLFYAVYKIFDRYKKGWLLFFWIFIVFALGTILILTYSRGVIIAVIVTSIFLFISKSKNFSFSNILTTAVVGGVVFMIVTNIQVDAELMFREMDTASGRTEIWDYYISQLTNDGPVRVLFGLGPGETIRIAQSSVFAEQYAHSLFLDFLCCFGIVGAIYLLYIIGSISKRLFKSQELFYMSLLVLLITMYLTHGIASTIQFYYMLGICMGGVIGDNAIRSFRK